MDGVRVPADRIVIREGRVGVLDAKGAVIERMDLPSNWMKPESKPDASVLTGNPYDFRTVAGEQLTPPKVMLGARLVDVPEHLLAHLEQGDAQRERVALVTEVIKGLPLDKAGIKDHDVIVAVNDIPDADPDAIRAVVRTLQPGDPINLRVLRNGKTFDARVEVAAWDPKHMVRPVGTNGKNIRLVRDAGTANASAAQAGAMPSATAPTAAPAASGAATPEQVAAAEAALAEARKQAQDAASAVDATRAQLATAQADAKAARDAAAAATAASVRMQSEMDATKAALSKANADLAAARAQADAAAKAVPAPVAAAPAPAPAPAAPAAAPANADTAQLRAALDRANARLAQLEKEARANDQVRRAIRPAPAPQPAPQPSASPASAPAPTPAAPAKP
jgi:hypothetical protein